MELITLWHSLRIRFIINQPYPVTHYYYLAMRFVVINFNFISKRVKFYLFFFLYIFHLVFGITFNTNYFSPFDQGMCEMVWNHETPRNLTTNINEWPVSYSRFYVSTYGVKSVQNIGTFVLPLWVHAFHFMGRCCSFYNDIKGSHNIVPDISFN